MAAPSLIHHNAETAPGIHWWAMARKAAAKETTFGADLIEGMKLVLAHRRGEIELEQVWPKPVHARAIRKRVKLASDSA